MFIKSLELENFRQFIGKQKIEFSQDKEKNVTIVTGNNGSGKTTIAQAFTWCLYASVSFADKMLLNKMIAQKMTPEDVEDVSVTIILTHNNIDYTITRAQSFRKDVNNTIKAIGSARFEIHYKNEDGQTEFVKSIDTEKTIKEILPKDLSGYFFFDGERMGKMSKEITKGKSKEFGEAVKKLLGLSAYAEALDHLNPDSKYSVVGAYNEKFDSSSDKRISEYNTRYSEVLEGIEKNKIETEKCIENIDFIEEKIDELEEFIDEHQEGQKLQDERRAYEDLIEKKKKSRLPIIKGMVDGFNKKAFDFMSKKLIYECLSELPDEIKNDVDIPNLNSDTIKFLITRNECICGSKFEAGDDCFKKLTRLLEFIPPENIGNIVKKFKDESVFRCKNFDGYFDVMKRDMNSLDEIDIEISDASNMIEVLDEKLKNTQGIGTKQEELRDYRRKKQEAEERKINLAKELGALEQEKKRIDTERDTLTLTNDKNKKIALYKEYACYIYDVLERDYDRAEAETRNKLQECINEIFNRIYNGGLELELDSSYNIDVKAKREYMIDDLIEPSQAQSISIILAFISGVIKLAKELNVEEGNITKAEPYPLVMDAPLSSFDKSRIENVCEVLPYIAEQIIIFIKDTDGDIAEKNLSGKIGKKYNFNNENAFITYIEE